MVYVQCAFVKRVEVLFEDFEMQFLVSSSNQFDFNRSEKAYHSPSLESMDRNVPHFRALSPRLKRALFEH